jgi:hypothetical protein
VEAEGWTEGRAKVFGPVQSLEVLVWDTQAAIAAIAAAERGRRRR